MSPRLPLTLAVCLLTAHAAHAQLAPLPRDLAPGASALPSFSSSGSMPSPQPAPSSSSAPLSPSAPSTLPAQALLPAEAPPPSASSSVPQRHIASAQPLPPPPPPRARRGAAQATAVVSGRIQQWLVNPNGEADGMVLADGTQVAFPPHLAGDITGLANVGETIQVTGWRAPGVPVMRAQSLSAKGRTVTDRPPEGRARPPREPGALTALSANGKIDRLLYNDRGDAHGVVLSDGTIVRFPPHVGAAFAGQLSAGSTLFAVGWGTRGAHGSAMEATRIGASADSLHDVFGPPQALRGPGPDTAPPAPAP